MLDPLFTASQLHQLAIEHPELHKQILDHPHCYPELATWIHNYSAAVQSQNISMPNQATAQALPSGTQATHPSPIQADYTPSDAQPSQSTNLPQANHTAPRPSSGKRKDLKIAIVVIAAIALIAAGAGTAFLFTQNTPEKAKTSYGFGVVTSNAHNVPESGAVLASKAAKDMVYSLVIINSEGEAAAHVMETKHGQKKSAIKAKLAVPLKDILADPSAALCSQVKALACQPAAKKDNAKNNSEAETIITLEKAGTLQWNPDSGQWSHDDTVFDANLIFGEVDGLVIGTQKAGSHAGNSDPSAIPVTQITAFDTKDATATWSKDLDNPSYVSVSNGVITVTEAGAIPDNSDALFNENLDNKDAIKAAETILEKAKDAKIYELVPAAKGKAESTQGGAEKEEAAPPKQRDGIKQIDFANAHLPWMWPDAPGCGSWFDQPGMGAQPKFIKMPDQGAEDCMWFTMKDGRSLQTVSTEGHSSQAILWEQSTATMFDIEKSDLSAIGDTHERWMIGYQDINGDQYLDAVILAGGQGEQNDIFVAIFDPKDPEHPYMSNVQMTMFAPPLLREDGAIENKGAGCARIDGMPPTFSQWDASSGGCG
ncbi:MAG: hypothetical protein Q4P66_08870 [Actinomycetaceae bacterium]|nr:hypothetical protein [Actinomycetaceae bacterium]